MAIPISDELKKAVKLFNRWQFQEAHDAFQQLSEEAEGRERSFLESLGQLSAGFYRIWHKGGEPNAMVNYLEKGIEMIRPYATTMILGLDMAGFDRELEACLEEARRWRRGESEIFNRDFIPRLEFIDATMD